MGPRHAGRGIVCVTKIPSIIVPKASMGPRHAGRGIVKCAEVYYLSLMSLQWVRATRGAVSEALAKGDIPLAMASMGPRHAGRGIESSWHAVAHAWGASMGPRHAGRGIDSLI